MLYGTITYHKTVMVNSGKTGDFVEGAARKISHPGGGHIIVSEKEKLEEKRSCARKILQKKKVLQ